MACQGFFWCVRERERGNESNEFFFQSLCNLQISTEMQVQQVEKKGDVYNNYSERESERWWMVEEFKFLSCNIIDRLCFLCFFHHHDDFSVGENVSPGCGYTLLHSSQCHFMYAVVPHSMLQILGGMICCFQLLLSNFSINLYIIIIITTHDIETIIQHPATQLDLLNQFLTPLD